MNHLCKTIAYTLTLLCTALVPQITSAAFVDEYEYGWTQNMGGIGEDIGRSVITDSSGNIYASGWFSGTVDFDPNGGDVRESAGGNDIFITSYTSDGTYRWTKTIGGIGEDTGFSITTDSLNNVYITGSFSGTVDFDPSAGVDSRISAGARDIFLTKLSPDGSYQWTRTIGGINDERGVSVVRDFQDNIYTTGRFQGTIDFDPLAGVDTKTSAGSDDIFITKLSPDGSYQWTKTMGGVGSDIGHSITTDSLGNIYATGWFNGTVDFNPDFEDERISIGGEDIFITKLSPDGSYQWTKTMGGIGSDRGFSITTDLSGNIHVTGSFSGTVDFDPSEEVDNRTSVGNADIFLTKFSPNGSYQWTRTMGGVGLDLGHSIFTDSSNNIYATGLFQGIVDFDPSAGVDNRISTGSGDIFLTKFSPDGSYQWIKTIGGINNDQTISGVVDAIGNIYITGWFQGTVDFNSNTADIQISAGGSDVFLTKLSRILPPEPEQEEEEEEQPAPRRRSGSKITPPTALTQPTTPVSSTLPTTTPTLPSTIPELQTLITQLQTQIQQIIANKPSALNNPASTTFTRDLQITMQGTDVTTLQQLLVSKGYTIPAGATGYFGEQTRQALIKFQQDNNITPAAGYFGPISRGQLMR